MSQTCPVYTQNYAPLIIGYFPFRAKAQIARLLCEYLHVPYVDMIFNPDEWTKYRENQAENWIIKDLPFLTDQDFTVTGCASMLHYIVQKAGRTDMLGRTLMEKVKIDSIRSRHDLRNAILGMVCTNRQTLAEDPRNCQLYWTSKIEPILKDYQAECLDNNWFYGAITIVDFFVYELFNLCETMFPNEVVKFKKLKALRNRVGAIKQIHDYETSDRAIKQYCPVRYFTKFKEEKLRRAQMDIE